MAGYVIKYRLPPSYFSMSHVLMCVCLLCVSVVSTHTPQLLVPTKALTAVCMRPEFVCITWSNGALLE